MIVIHHVYKIFVTMLFYSDTMHFIHNLQQCIFGEIHLRFQVKTVSLAIQILKGSSTPSILKVVCYNLLIQLKFYF